MKHSSMKNMYRNKKKIIQFLVLGHSYLTEYTTVPSLYSYLIYFIKLPPTHSNKRIKKS